MPVGEIAGELFGGVFKFLGRLFFEFFIEILIKGTGYFICRMFSKRVNPDGMLVVLVGLVFLGLLAIVFFMVFDLIQLQLTIDECLDSGGRFDYEMETCQKGL
jgi:predicted PurR-regulated permease PerM